LLEDVKEQEWRNSHVAYHDTHSSFLYCVVFIHVLSKLHTYMRQRAAISFGRKEAHDTPADVSYTAAHGKGSTVNINIHNSNDSL